jgi:NADPH:quinone reductase
VLVRQTAIGVNYVDIYHRKGVYPLPYPSGLGVEAAGVVEAEGEQVSFVKRGDRVAYSGLPGDPVSQTLSRESQR